MRWVALALMIISLPILIGWLKARRARRDYALTAIGLLTFLGGDLAIEPSIISWPVWAGLARGIFLTPSDVLALALIATRGGSHSRVPFRLLIAVYAIPVMLSMAFSPVPFATFFVVVQVLQMGVLFVAVAGEVARPGALRSLLIGLSLGLMLQAGYVIQQKLSGVVQAPGTFVHQNLLGMMVELAVLPVVAAVLEGERSKIMYGGIIGGMIVIAGGGSRAAMAIVAVAIGVLVLVSIARRMTPRKLQVMGMGVLALAIAVPLGQATLKDRFGDASVLSQEEQRAALARSARLIADDYPFGVGANQFVPVTNTGGYATRAGVAWSAGNRAIPVHNSYLLARAETGRAGEIMQILLLMIPALAGLRLAFGRRKGATPGIVLGVAVALIAVAVHNLFEYAWAVRTVQVMFFLNLAIIAGSMRAAKLERTASRRAALAQAEQPIAEPAAPALASLSRPTG
ncbi:MAG: hypothetical protein B7Z08_00170 [Sphingomonadales bacterium 32-68-7]|nr:MAG: hypothetical protein B7Z33_09395 [Sphingomonadales bacterium 12-68-11]OYX10551.1 MAG: hypothetical protein B7Z08_00170 [Sphingomonadales bacterium 32-68-7]